MVNIALAIARLSSCPAVDARGSAQITAAETIAAVNGAAAGNRNPVRWSRNTRLAYHAGYPAC